MYTTVDDKMIQFQKGMVSFMNLFQIDVQKKQTDAMVRLYTKLNKDLSKLDFEGITPLQAATKLEITQGFAQVFNALLAGFSQNTKIKRTHKNRLIPILSKTSEHLEQIIEALEIYADAEAMEELDNFLKKSA